MTDLSAALAYSDKQQEGESAFYLHVLARAVRELQAENDKLHERAGEAADIFSEFIRAYLAVSQEAAP